MMQTYISMFWGELEEGAEEEVISFSKKFKITVLTICIRTQAGLCLFIFQFSTFLWPNI